MSEKRTSPDEATSNDWPVRKRIRRTTNQMPIADLDTQGFILQALEDRVNVIAGELVVKFSEGTPPPLPEFVDHARRLVAAYDAYRQASRFAEVGGQEAGL